MQFLNKTFRPGILPSALVIVMFPVLLSLGFWQLDRAETKESIYRTFLEKRKMPSVELNSTMIKSPNEDMIWKNISIAGRFVSVPTYLLDNQVQDGVAGYHVITPFLIEGMETIILVNRGWVPAPQMRDQLPEISTPETRLRLDGTLYEVVQNPFLKDVAGDMPVNGLLRVQQLLPARIDPVPGYDTFNYLLRLAPDADAGYKRDWPEPGSGMEKHLGYAFQWFMLAVVLVIIYFAVSLERNDKDG